ncbi:hypothetical protein FA13DRAFT_935324 [Coprinellus micaceus]|uniref:Uncharacterized protein n=1 Tax=Coprinellus micaceus TaxID=71717 RepID=A0A4Y7SZY7_COPMI|nr:hypothetical protein FA13DRAFT_935324 [Coprinellus micaceus]
MCVLPDGKGAPEGYGGAKSGYAAGLCEYPLQDVSWYGLFTSCSYSAIPLSTCGPQFSRGGKKA